MTKAKELPINDPPQVGDFRHLPAAWKTMIVKDWSRRTKFGKLLFPLWLILSSFEWAVLISLILVFLIPQCFEQARDWWVSNGWNVYKDD